LLLFYKPLHLEAQQVSTRIEVRRYQLSSESLDDLLFKSNIFDIQHHVKVPKAILGVHLTLVCEIFLLIR
jgi:hypothetical protein